MTAKRNAMKTQAQPQTTNVIRLPKRPTATPERDAQQAYAEHAQAIKGYAEALTTALQGHVKAGEALNWGHVGDVAHIENLLKQAVCFLTGEDY